MRRNKRSKSAPLPYAAKSLLGWMYNNSTCPLLESPDWKVWKIQIQKLKRRLKISNYFSPLCFTENIHAITDFDRWNGNFGEHKLMMPLMSSVIPCI